MRVPRLLALIACITAACPLALLSQQSSAQSTQATTLLQQTLKALTGGTPVTDVTLSATAHRVAGSDDENGTATLKATILGDSRIDMAFASGNRVEIRNHAGTPLSAVAGTNSTGDGSEQVLQPVGAWSGPDGVLHGMATQNVMTDAAWFFPAATVTTILANPSSFVVSYLGQEPCNGQTCVGVQINEPPTSSGIAPAAQDALAEHLTQMNLLLDPASYLPVALDFNSHPDDDAASDIPTEIRFDDYRYVNGVSVPYHIQKYLNNALLLDFQLDGAVLNSGLPSSTFDLQ